MSATSLRDEIAGRAHRPLLLLLAAVGLVLLVTCANTANLVLSRAAGRTREVALRSALGSSRGRLLQLLLTEATLLSVAGGVAGVAIATLVVAALPAVIVDALLAAGTAPIDVRVLAFASGLVIATALLFALIPLVTVERGAPGRTLQEEAARTTPGVRRHRVQAALVVSTVALARALLAGAGPSSELHRSHGDRCRIHGGPVLAATVTLPRAGYTSAASVRGFTMPPSGRRRHCRAFGRLRSPRPAARKLRAADPDGGGGTIHCGCSSQHQPAPGPRGPYFATLGIRLRSGRHFTDDEDRARRNVVIVNHRLAAVFWPGQDAVGKRLRWGLDLPQNPNPWLTVVGVVDDVSDGPLGAEPDLHADEPFIQFPNFVLENFPGSFGRDVTLALRTEGDPRALASALRGSIARIDPQLAVRSMATMEERIAEVLAPRRFSTLALGAFAAGSLLLAGIGLYGLLAFSVAERRRENCGSGWRWAPRRRRIGTLGGWPGAEARLDWPRAGRRGGLRGGADGGLVPLSDRDARFWWPSARCRPCSR